MLKHVKKLLAATLAAALAFSGAAAGASVSSVDASAASKATVYQVTKATNSNGGVTTYKYNKQGLVSQETYTYSSTDKSKYGDSESIWQLSQDLSASSSASVANPDGTTTETAATYKNESDTYFYYTTESAEKTSIKAVTKYTYYTKGKSKGQIKTESTTYTTTENYSKTTSSNGATISAALNAYYASHGYTTTDSYYGTYDADNSGSCSYTSSYTTKTTYTYNKKGVLTGSETVTTTPKWTKYTTATGEYAYDNSSKYGTYSYSTDNRTVYAFGSNGSDMITESDLANDKIVSTATTTYKAKKGKITSASTVLEVVSTDVDDTNYAYRYTSNSDNYYYDSSFKDDGYTYVTTTTYDPKTTKYTYKKGRVVKEVYSDPGTGTSVSVINGSCTSSYAYNGETATPYTRTYNNRTYTEDVQNDAQKATTTYKYDKSGNLKKAVVSNDYTDYLTTASSCVSDGALTSVYVKTTPVSYTYTVEDEDGNTQTHTETYRKTTSETVSGSTKTTYTNGVNYATTKKGTYTYSNEEKGDTGMISKSVATKSFVTNGAKDTGKTLSSVSYTVKKKKAASAYKEIVEAQQHYIQNGVQTTDSYIGY